MFSERDRMTENSDQAGRPNKRPNYECALIVEERVFSSVKSGENEKRGKKEKKTQ